MFSISIAGRRATRDELLPEWGPLSRFGVVISEPFGAVAASGLLQLAITAFYDTRPQRRSREDPVYPDIFVFHGGGRFGDHSYFDVYPPRKEVFVADRPELVLDAINDRGITHLAVPDVPAEAVRHGWKEPQQAKDRIAATWAYATDGRVDRADVTVSATSPRAEANVKMTLHPDQSYGERQEALAAIGPSWSRTMRSSPRSIVSARLAPPIGIDSAEGGRPLTALRGGRSHIDELPSMTPFGCYAVEADRSVSEQSPLQSCLMISSWQESR